MKRHVGVLNKHNGIYAKNIYNTISNGFCLPGHDSRRILVIFNLNWTRRIHLILGLFCVPINFLYSNGVMSCQCKLENNIYPKLDCRKLYTHPLNFICRIIRKGYVTNVSPEQFAPFIQNLFAAVVATIRKFGTCTVLSPGTDPFICQIPLSFQHNDGIMCASVPEME